MRALDPSWRFKLADEQLILVAVELFDLDAIVTMTDYTGITYKVQLAERDGLVSLARITRTFPHVK